MASELDNLPDEEIPTGETSDTSAFAGLMDYLEFFRAWLVVKDQAVKAEYRQIIEGEIKPGHLAFIYHYMTPGKAQGKAWTAAIAAGLPGNHGQYLRVKYGPFIQAIFDDLEYSPEQIRLEVAKMFHAEKTVFFQDKGVVTDERTVKDNASILKALELASKHQGMLKEKVDHEFPNGIPISTAALPDEDRALLKANLDAIKKQIVERELAKDADKE